MPSTAVPRGVARADAGEPSGTARTLAGSTPSPEGKVLAQVRPRPTRRRCQLRKRDITSSALGRRARQQLLGERVEEVRAVVADVVDGRGDRPGVQMAVGGLGE